MTLRTVIAAAVIPFALIHTGCNAPTDTNDAASQAEALKGLPAISMAKLDTFLGKSFVITSKSCAPNAFLCQMYNVGDTESFSFGSRFGDLGFGNWEMAEGLHQESPCPAPGCFDLSGDGTNGEINAIADGGPWTRFHAALNAGVLTLSSGGTDASPEISLEAKLVPNVPAKPCTKFTSETTVFGLDLASATYACNYGDGGGSNGLSGTVLESEVVPVFPAACFSGTTCGPVPVVLARAAHDKRQTTITAVRCATTECD